MSPEMPTPDQCFSRDLAQVMTPQHIVDRMLDLIPLFGEPVEHLAHRKFMEPSYGDGAFVAEIIRRLMARYTQDAPEFSPQHWFHHVMERQVYGIDIDPEMQRRCLRRVDELARQYGTRLRRHNLMVGDFLQMTAPRQLELLA